MTRNQENNSKTTKRGQTSSEEARGLASRQKGEETPRGIVPAPSSKTIRNNEVANEPLRSCFQTAPRPRQKKASGSLLFGFLETLHKDPNKMVAFLF